MPTPLERLQSLPHREQRAFIALCEAPKMRDTILVRGDSGATIYPDFGKTECRWVDDWRDFYKFKLPILRLIEFEEAGPRPALGMIEGSICIEVTVYITDAGREALDAWWARENRSK